MRGDACALPFGDQSFDLVVCLEILEHLPDPAARSGSLARSPRRDACLGVPHEPFLRLGNLRRGGNVTRLGDPTDHRQPRRPREFAAFGGRELAVRIRAGAFPGSSSAGRSERYFRLGLLLVLALGLALRAWSAAYGLPDLYHPDEPRIVERAVRFHQGDLNPRFFNWPSLYMYVMAGVYGIAFGALPGGVAGAFGRDPGALLPRRAAGHGALRHRHARHPLLHRPARLWPRGRDPGGAGSWRWISSTSATRTGSRRTCRSRSWSRSQPSSRSATGGTGASLDAGAAGLVAGLATSMKYPGGLAFLGLWRPMPRGGRPARPGAASWDGTPSRRPAWRPGASSWGRPSRC